MRPRSSAATSFAGLTASAPIPILPARAASSPIHAMRFAVADSVFRSGSSMRRTSSAARKYVASGGAGRSQKLLRRLLARLEHDEAIWLGERRPQMELRRRA
jgi:hypothetical protein